MATVAHSNDSKFSGRLPFRAKLEPGFPEKGLQHSKQECGRNS